MNTVLKVISILALLYVTLSLILIAPMVSMTNNNTIIPAPTGCEFIKACKDRYVFVVGSEICYVWTNTSSSYICYSPVYGVGNTATLVYNTVDCTSTMFGAMYPGIISDIQPSECLMEQ